MGVLPKGGLFFIVIRDFEKEFLLNETGVGVGYFDVFAIKKHKKY